MREVILIGILLVVGAGMDTCGRQPAVTEAQKRHFIELVPRLPNDGEFLTEKGVSRAARYTPVLFVLGETDLEGCDLYPFLALSRGLADRKDTREYAVRHFGDITHPVIKLLWAVILFSDYGVEDDVLDYLRTVLDSETQSSTLAEMLGPEFEQFKADVLSRKR